MKLSKPNILVSFLLLQLIITIPCFSGAAEWKQMPLRTANQKTAGLMGGEGMQMIYGIAYAPSNPQIVYLVSDTSQVWKSIDGGNNWQIAHKGFHANGGISIAVDPFNENIVLVAGSLTESGAGFAGKATGIFRTTDGGDNWQVIKNTEYNTNLSGKCFAFDPASFDRKRTRVIYAGTHQDGLLKSIDGGDSWTNIAFNGVKIYDVKLDPRKTLETSLTAKDGLHRYFPYRVYISAENGFYRYDDRTKEISKIGLGLPTFPREISINPQDPKIIYAAVGTYGVYRSVDSGEHFESRNNGLFLPNQEFRYISLSPVKPEYLYTSINQWGALSPFWSHDGGATWHYPTTLDKGELSLTGGGRYFAATIEPHPTDPNIALTSANGADRIIKTDNAGEYWSYSGNGYTGGRKATGKTSHAFYNDTQKMIFFLIDFGPALTEDGGDTFRLLPIPRVFGMQTTPVGAVDKSGYSEVIVTAIGDWYRQLITVSEDGGDTWRTLPGTEDQYKFMSFHPQKLDIIYAQGWKSEDRGKSWNPLSKKVRAVYQGNGDIVYSYEDVNYNTIFFKSEDAGQTWINSFGTLPIPSNEITEIEVDPVNQNRIYVSAVWGLYIYDNGRWIKKGEESGLSKDRFGWISFNCVTVDPSHPDVVYVGRWAPGMGQSNGVFRSTDFGQTWENITYNMGPEITCWSLSVSPHDGKVYFGSSHGTWVLAPPY